MALLDPEGSERHMRDSELTRTRLAKLATEPVLHRVYAERPAPDPEAPAPARRRTTKRKHR